MLRINPAVTRPKTVASVLSSTIPGMSVLNVPRVMILCSHKPKTLAQKAESRVRRERPPRSRKRNKISPHQHEEVRSSLRNKRRQILSVPALQQRLSERG